MLKSLFIEIDHTCLHCVSSTRLDVETGRWTNSTSPL